ncbi:MAG TPA: tetratricopeptide repeat protein [Coleofasciculaceae cyanobacterium]
MGKWAMDFDAIWPRAIADPGLESLEPAVRSLLWAVAVPHWFDAAMVAALEPGLADRADALYAQLQAVAIVEPWPGRGHRVCELIRRELLDRLWADRPEALREWSARAAAVGQRSEPDDIDDIIERLYHLAVADPDRAGEAIDRQARAWHQDFQLEPLAALLNQVGEQADRTSVGIRALVAYWEGELWFRQYRTTEAYGCYERALDLYRSLGDRLGGAMTLQAVGELLQFVDRHQAAQDCYEQALDLYRAIDHPLGAANTLKALGDLGQLVHQWDNAQTCYEQALGLYQSLGDRLGEANTFQSLGDLGQFLQRPEDSEAHYDRALELYRAVNNRVGEANTLRALGYLLQLTDRRDAAQEHYEQALALYRALGAPLGEANTRQGLGDLLQLADQGDAAQAQYEQALALYRVAGDRLGEANTLQLIALLAPDPAAALVQLAESRAIYEAIGDRYGQGRNWWFTAAAHEDLGQIPEAIAALEARIECGRVIGYDPFVTSAQDLIQELQDLQSS